MKEQDFYENLYREVQDSGATGWYIKKSHKALERGFPESTFANILEVGGNVGEHIQFVKSNFESYVLTDYRETGFLSNDVRIKFQISDVHCLPFEDEKFSRSISTCLLHHLSDPKRALEEMRRVTKSGGLVSLLIPCDPGILYRFAKKVGPSRKWKNSGVSNPMFLHYQHHRNHYPGINSIVREVFKSDQVKTSFWPFKLHSWNTNLFTVHQIRINQYSREDRDK